MRKLFFMSGAVDLDPEMEEYLFDQMDLDGSGLIAFEEFAVVMLTAGETKLDADKTARRMLRCFDPEKKGFITHDKVEARLKEIRPSFDSRPIVRLLRSGQAQTT
jgi:Ca2+-binding EF-hand superfamily protein